MKIFNQTIAVAILLVFFMEILLPVASYAITSGPSQPEFTDFEPLGTTGMVNEFTGQFTYNVPLIEVPGPHGSSYPLTLTYHSGASVEEDASWVGFGWSLNPGAIQRAVRGLPDDYNGEDAGLATDNITHEYDEKPIETWVLGHVDALQAASMDLFSFDRANRYNTMTGFSTTSGFSISLGNFLAFTWRSQNGVTRFTASPNWMNVLQWATETLAAKASQDANKNMEESKLDAEAKPTVQVTEANKGVQESASESSSESPVSTGGVRSALYASVANYLGRSIGDFGLPSVMSSTESNAYHGNFAFTLDAVPVPVVIGINSGSRGSLTVHKNINSSVNRGAYGMLYAHQQYTAGVPKDWSLSDATRDKESDFNGRDRFLSPTYAMYDQFSCSAHGVSGVMRFVHTQIGVHGPVKATSGGTTATLGFEAGFGAGKISGGASIALGSQDGVLQYSALSSSSATYSAFRNTTTNSVMGDRNGVFMRCTGDLADNVRYSTTLAPLAPRVSSNSSISFPTSGVSQLLNASGSVATRPRASTNVAFRTNRELISATTGMTGGVTGWSCDSSISRRGKATEKFVDRTESQFINRIAELAMTNTSGVTYVYGLPVYSRWETTRTYAGDSVAKKYKHHNRLVRAGLKDDDHPTGIVKSKGYASSFLLTEVYTQDYIDLGARGPGTDDLGGYVSFRYKQAAGTEKKNRGSGLQSARGKWFRWRTPYFGSTFSNDQLSQSYDDKASVNQGEKELYYVEAIETKTHVAFFVTNKTKLELTIAGQARTLSGSMKERFDAYEALNTGSNTVIDSVMSYFPDVDIPIATSIDNSGASRSGLGGWKKFGGLGRRSGESITEASDDWVNANSRPNKSEYLEKVVLVAKDSLGNLTEILQTVNLEYTYELMARPATWRLNDRTYYADTFRILPEREWDTIYYTEGLLNSAYYFSNDSIKTAHTSTRVNIAQHGKLTLKRMWIDYGDVKSAAISPYEFSYQYPRDGVDDFEWSDAVASSSVWSGAREFSASYTKTTATPGLSLESTNANVQNPAYDPVRADAWGSFWRSGVGSYWSYGPQVSQHAVPGENVADDTYDPAAWQLKMITLPSGAQLHVQYEANTYSYVQDQQAMALVKLDSAVASGSAITCWLDVEAMLPGRGVDAIKTELLTHLRKEQRLFFKFLYPLAACGKAFNTTSFPPAAEYLSGFAPVDSADVTTEVIAGTTHLKIVFNGDPQPYKLMEEYLYNRQGGFPSCGSSHRISAQAPSSAKKDEEDEWDKLAKAGPAIARRAREIHNMYSVSNQLPYVNFSYIRIPAVWKYGGGIRVKRIFLHDIGIEPGAGGLYGNEYTYDLDEGGTTRSSGVATNEPVGIREENPFFRFIQGKDDQSWLDRLAAGEEIDQFSGPICENALPGPSIGYSRVVTTSIAQVPTAPGYTVSEFYTAKDFPIKVDYTPIEKKTDYKPLLMTGFLNIQEDYVGAAQGFVVHTNSMHGRIRGVAKYAGTPSGQTEIVESLTYEYYLPHEKKPVLVRQTDGWFKIEQRFLGVEEEMHIDSREYETSSINGSIPFDIGIMLLLTPIGHVGLPSVNRATSEVHIATMTRILTHPAMMKTITAYKSSIRTTSTNVAFDPLTGTPVVVRSFDDQHTRDTDGGVHSGVMHDVTIPAWNYYDGMGPKSENDMVTAAVNVSGSNPTVTLTNVAGPPGLTTLGLRIGDLVHLQGNAANIYTVTALSGTPSATLTTGRNSSAAQPSGPVRATVLRSVRANRLEDIALSYRKYGSSINENNVVDSVSNILKASAMTFDNTWQEYPMRTFPSGYTDWDKGRKRWRQKNNCVYRAAATDLVSNTSNRSYNTGVSSAVMVPYNFSGANGAEWVRTSSIVSYNADGDAVFEVDALGIPSTAIFGHQSSVPICIAKGADTGSVAFESFEDGTTSLPAHTGKRSAALTSTFAAFTSVRVSTITKTGGLIARAWVQYRGPGITTIQIGSTNIGMSPQQQINGWHLVQAIIPSALLSTITDTTSQLTVSMKITGNSGSAYVDDVRLQPTNSSATCYVYDPASLRLIAQFDDRHYAALFKYDQEGKLIRKDRETSRGVHPLHEAHYNKPTKPHTPAPETLMQRAADKRAAEQLNSLMPDIMIPLGPSGVKKGSSFDMLQINVDPTRVRYNLFGRDSTSEVHPDSLRKLFKPNENDR